LNKRNIYRILGYICFGGAAIISVTQRNNPRLDSALVSSVLVVAGFVFDFIHAKVNHIRIDPFYHADRKKHIRNWIIYISSIILTAVLVGLVYWLFIFPQNKIG
jgi:hypothetical protein